LTAEVAALGVSITATLGGTRQIVLQNYIAADTPTGEKHRLIDEMMALADRQSAKADIIELRKEQEELARSLAQYDVDRVEADRQFDKAQAELDVQILTLQSDHKDFYEKGYNTHVGGGRTGSYKPKGAAESHLKVLELQVEKIKEAKEKNVAERDQHIHNLEVSINARKTRADVAGERIAELQALIDGE
jgi:hypothetical protein